MLKDEAIDLLGGSVGRAAELMGVTYQAINKWPEVLPQRISDRVLGVCARRGICIPCRFVQVAESTPNPPPALASQALQAINSVVEVA